MNRLLRSLVFTALIAVVAVPATAGSWSIDTAHSVMNFKVRHLFSKVGGSFEQWEGSLEFDGENPASLTANVMIQTASVNTDNAKRDGHLKSPDFFDAEQFPTISFVSKKVEQGEDGWALVGDFTMHGVTQEIAIPFEFYGAGKDPWGGTRAGFSASFTVNRKDFGIEWNKTLDSGGAMLGDEVVIDLEIEAVEAEAVEAEAGR
jgi:polyisoprenoid-binding protein YceI